MRQIKHRPRRCFNSRSREGATLSLSPFGVITPCFNSRSREGATKIYKKEGKENEVSIHAPVRERRLISIVVLLPTSFNSRSREGATVAFRSTIQHAEFQFTLP